MKSKYSVLVLFFSLLYIGFIQFYHLGSLPVIQWDESRLAVNAAEMSVSNDFLVTSFERQPDLYNTKPPLMIWLQVLSIKCLGLNEWAIRLPSAFAGFCTILLTGLFVFKSNKNTYAACLAMLILTTCDGFIQLHGSLTGDYDALLTLFLLLSIYCIYLFSTSGHVRYFYAFVFFVALSVLTKSAAALILFPVYFALFYYQSGVKYFTRLATGLFIALMPFVVFCVLRELASTGYLQAIWNNDFGGRFLDGKDGHEGAWYYYIHHLFTFRFSWFIGVLPIAIIWGINKQNKAINSMSIILILYGLLISVAKTKLEWYDLPILPVISILIALFFVDVINATSIKPVKAVSIFIVLACLSWCLMQKYYFIHDRKNLRLSWDIYTISEQLRTYKGQENLYYHTGGYDAWNYFYTLSNPYVKRADYNKLENGQKILTNDLFSDSLKNKYTIQTLDSNKNAKTIQITGIK